MPTLNERTIAALKACKDLEKGSLRNWAGASVLAAAVATGGVGAIAMGTVGAALLAPTVWRVVFPRRRKRHHNRELTRDELDYKFWDCRIFKIGVIGPRGTGKTTIKMLIQGLSVNEVVSTTDMEYHLVQLDKKSKKYGALIDGAGTDEAFGDQLNLARQSNILIVVLDHFNTRDEKKLCENNCDKKRLSFHKRFVNNVFTKLNAAPLMDLRRVIFLINKKDLWMQGNDRATVEQWVEDLKANVRARHASELPDQLPFRPFDKEDKQDLNWLLDELRKAIK